MNQKWMNTLCRDIASQVVHNAIYPRLEEYDPQEALENIIKEVTNTLTNANWRQWTQEIIDSKIDESIEICLSCQHNYIPTPEMEAKANGINFTNYFRLCNNCINERENTPTTCSRCKQLFPKRLLTFTAYKLSGTFCSECYPLALEEAKIKCIICQQKYLPWEGTKYFCAACNTPEHQKEIQRVQTHNSRAEKEKQAKTLTIHQWIETLNYFKWKCAYCQGTYKGLEHYIPLPHGGTTQTNCFPSCHKCNHVKKDKLPEQFERLFPTENIKRIKEYIVSKGCVVMTTHPLEKTP